MALLHRSSFLMGCSLYGLERGPYVWPVVVSRCAHSAPIAHASPHKVPNLAPNMAPNHGRPGNGMASRPPRARGSTAIDSRNDGRSGARRRSAPSCARSWCAAIPEHATSTRPPRSLTDARQPGSPPGAALAGRCGRRGPRSSAQCSWRAPSLAGRSWRRSPPAYRCRGAPPRAVAHGCVARRALAMRGAQGVRGPSILPHPRRGAPPRRQEATQSWRYASDRAPRRQARRSPREIGAAASSR